MAKCAGCKTIIKGKKYSDSCEGGCLFVKNDPCWKTAAEERKRQQAHNRSLKFNE